MDADSPWCRKIERAYVHLEELKRVLAEYEARSPYIAVRDPESGTGDAMAYRAKLVSEPSEDLPLIIGDFVHNLRASLDHVAVALLPPARRRKHSFPVAQHDIWRTDPQTTKDRRRSEAVARSRRSYNDAVKGMPPEAQRAIENIQPLRHKGERSWLRNLHALDLADKHHSLLTTAEGIENPSMRLRSVPHDFDVRVQIGTGVFRDGAVVTTLPDDLTAATANASVPIERIIDAFRSGDVKVHPELIGTARVGLELPYLDNPVSIPDVLDDMHSQAWKLVDLLGWFVQEPSY